MWILEGPLAKGKQSQSEREWQDLGEGRGGRAERVRGVLLGYRVTGGTWLAPWSLCESPSAICNLVDLNAKTYREARILSLGGEQTRRG